MIKKMLPAALVLLPLILLSSCGYRPKANEELYGTWTNESYGVMTSAIFMPQKEVIDASGHVAYTNISDHDPAGKGTERIASKWIDSEGNIWYKTFGTISNGDKVLTIQTLHKLSKSATVQEYVSVWLSKPDPNNYPTKIDPKDANYRIYNRAGK